MTTKQGMIKIIIMPNLEHLIIRKSKMEWISVEDRMPEKTEENDGKVFYTFSYGVVSDYEWFSSYPRESTGWSGESCKGGFFYGPNSDSDYGGEFRAEGVTHWMEKPVIKLPPSPKLK